ncbi:hypothetical protein Q5424_19360 [Conexibacter sp. JD483]|uniref:hypothetical protein n=1 Tax=unclassified Conexibacter TaxID=2627773 RepID=UPI00271EA9D0|nr:MULTISPECIES: hypothetical protein [unclassified Conexibacter]MDO8187045.1 hypothetical protein [Conexibacter sp. CPCC 205706]MDO8200637.1 hypothetical protein [Conexibacter sp. CPCC 205762]MDR9371265.1 hypothetical protein [Conexibacter sp. JD483]
MSTFTRFGACAVAVVVAFGAAAAASASAATSWTQIASPTRQDITAIDYRGDTQAWLGSSGGQIASADATGAFQIRSNTPGVSITDIAFNAAGTVGYATTSGGTALRSVDAGVTWRAVTLPAQVRSTCGSTATPVAISRLNAIAWAGDDAVWLVGGTSTTAPIVLRADNATVTTPTFTDRNWIGVAPWCRVSGSTHPISDVATVTGSSDFGIFVNDYFGEIFRTIDALATPATKTGEVLAHYEHMPRMAIDPGNPDHIWVVDNGANTRQFVWSDSGGTSSSTMQIVGSPTGIGLSLYGVSYGGGALVAVGDAGEIYTSIDGKNAYLQRATGGLETTNWRSVSVADGGRALVGGAGGVLIRTTTANSIPDTTAPTGTISGPTALTTGQAGTYTAQLADNAGGSGIDPASIVWSSPGTPGATGTTTASFAFTTTGYHSITVSFKDLAGNAATTSIGVTVSAATPAPPARRGGGSGTPAPANAGGATRTTTGGAAITTYKKISIGKGRFVPVWISARTPRRFVIEIRSTGKKPRRIATAKTSLRGGKKLVRVGLKRSIKTGKYVVTVRVFVGKRAIGKRVRTVFAIAK